MWSKRVIPIYWGALQVYRAGENKRRCPFCTDGILPLTRDPKTLTLLDTDSCLGCGQRVRYLDMAWLQAQEKPGAAPSALPGEDQSCGSS